MYFLKTIISTLIFTIPIAAGDIPLKLPILSHRKDSAVVLFENADGSKRYVFNAKRAGIRYSPASTFKILNTLIVLEKQVIPSPEAILKWDGIIHELPDWNKDQTLRSAFKASCVWFYQTLAERVGMRTYVNYLQKLSFGNALTGNSVKNFWLDSSLQISAKEQILFLKALQTRKLPFAPENYEILRQIMLIDDSKSYKIYAKTGWAMRATPQIGWYVGFVEMPADTWFFAINLDVLNAEDLKIRQAILKEVLREAGISE